MDIFLKKFVQHILNINSELWELLIHLRGHVHKLYCYILELI